jgi:recombination protein RecA
MTKAKKPAGNQAVEETIERIRRRFGAGAAVVPGHDPAMSEVREAIPCGIDVVDRYVFGLGGVPRGRIVEVFSEPGVAKTTYSLAQLSGAQRVGGLAIYCDSEKSWDNDRAALLGVDLNALVLLQPDTLEESLEQMELALDGHDVRVPMCLIWDSLAESQFKGDMTGSYDKESADNRAKMINKWCRRMAVLSCQSQASVIVINQTRQKRGLVFGNATTTPGGDGLKFLASLRVQLFGGKAIKDKLGHHVGKAVTFLAVKSRFSQPFRKAKVRLDYAHGWDNLWSTISHAKDMGVIAKGARWNADTYREAVKALGWEGAAEATTLLSTEGVEDTDIGDEEVEE